MIRCRYAEDSQWKFFPALPEHPHPFPPDGLSPFQQRTIAAKAEFRLTFANPVIKGMAVCFTATSPTTKTKG
jgi:hypothetical protein